MAVEPLRKPENCPIKEDPRVQDFTWRVERLGWIFMALLIVAALLGLFGGPTTRREAQDASGRLRVAYQHFQRNLAPTEFEIAVDPQSNPVIDLVIDKELSGAFEIRTLAPQPLEIQAHNGGLLMRFAISSDSAGIATIVIKAFPDNLGRVRGSIGLLNEPGAPVDIVVYP